MRAEPRVSPPAQGIPSPVWRFLYDLLLVPFGWVVFHIFGWVDRKARRALEGRKELWRRLEGLDDKCPTGSGRIWFHVASMGEFEQAKPMIAELKRRDPSKRIIVSFFSPSGYEHSAKYPLADFITYIPFDSRANARKFIGALHPSAAVFVRYDLWPNHVWECRETGIPVLLASATMRRTGIQSFPVVRSFYRALYNTVDAILTVSENDRRGFEMLGLDHPVVSVIGDTRYDQVVTRSLEARKRQIIDQAILAGKKVLVIGSSWKEDDAVLLPACFRCLGEHPEMLVILVPHEPTLENLEEVENAIEGHSTVIRFSLLGQYAGERIILIDSVGILTTLYKYGHAAYVGGSFGSGIHNVLEPAVYGIPVLMGPVHENSQEAVAMVAEHAGFVCSTWEDFASVIERYWREEDFRKTAGEKAAEFVRRQTGATERFLGYFDTVRKR